MTPRDKKARPGQRGRASIKADGPGPIVTHGVYPTSSVQEALEAIGSPEEILERHGIPVRREMARCPFHDDRTPSLSIFIGRAGKTRWFCHGCGAGGDSIDLAQRLGERVELRSRSTPRPTRPRPAKPISKAHKEISLILGRRGSIGFELAAAMTLARVHRTAALVELERNREYLSTFGSLDFIVQLADEIRAYLPERYGVPPGFHWPRELVWQAIEGIPGGA